jgi:hypothetical protein
MVTKRHTMSFETQTTSTMSDKRRPSYLRDDSHIHGIVEELKRRRQEAIFEIMTKPRKIK